MERTIRVGTHSTAGGVVMEWVTGFEISVVAYGSEVTIRANAAGLLSLAQHLATLAADDVPPGAHIHLDQHNGLEDGSVDLILERLIE
jgi:hypothetical protein